MSARACALVCDVRARSCAYVISFSQKCFLPHSNGSCPMIEAKTEATLYNAYFDFILATKP